MTRITMNDYDDGGDDDGDDDDDVYDNDNNATFIVIKVNRALKS